MPEFHSRLGASSYSRWGSCPGSVKLEAGIPATTSVYAEEGTLAHAFCEAELNRRFFGVKPRLAKLRKSELYDKEMEKHAMEYGDFVYSIAAEHIGEPPDVYVEHMVNYCNIAPGGFGTADCILAFPGELHVIDFKYGKGVPVSAVGNPQMRLYAYGAYRELNFMLDIKNVHMHIFQPRIENFSSDEIPADELRKWANEEVRIAAELALSDNPPYNPSPTACRWCRAKNLCKARADWLASAHGKNPDLLTPEQIGELLPLAKELEGWAKDLTGEAQSMIEQGERVPGYKLVIGRAGNRSFTDADKAIQRAKDAGIAEAMLYERRPITLSAMEKLMGKEDFELACGDLVTRAPGKPTLVPESDKRQAYNPNAAVAAEFGLDL